MSSESITLGKGSLINLGYATDDLVPIPAKDLLWKGNRLPFLMSRKAELDGWSAVVWLTPVEVNSAPLAGWLRHDFFEGEPAWRFFLQPIAVLLLPLLLGWLLLREWNAREERNLVADAGTVRRLCLPFLRSG